MELSLSRVHFPVTTAVALAIVGLNLQLLTDFAFG